MRARDRENEGEQASERALVPVNIRLFAFLSLNARFYLIERQRFVYAIFFSLLFRFYVLFIGDSGAWQYVQFFFDINMGGANGRKCCWLCVCAAAAVADDDNGGSDCGGGSGGSGGVGYDETMLRFSILRLEGSTIVIVLFEYKISADCRGV